MLFSKTHMLSVIIFSIITIRSNGVLFDLLINCTLLFHGVMLLFDDRVIFIFCWCSCPLSCASTK